MRHVVKDERHLPSAAAGAYVRCSALPTVVTHPVTGDAYVREDGAPWPQAGYRVNAMEVRPCATREGFSDPGAAVAALHWNDRPETPNPPAVTVTLSPDSL